MRRTKESIISVALQLQVAIKLSQEDELTITSLLTQTAESKAKELVAKSKSEEATSIVNQLNLELNVLKRRLNVIEAERIETNAPLSVHHQMAMSEEAEIEVDHMLSASLPLVVPRNISEKVQQAATPFDRWKMNQFLFSSDTPAASEQHDAHVVDMLLDVASNMVDSRNLTISTIGKYQRLYQDKGQDELHQHTLTKTSPTRRTDRDFYLSEDLDQAWGKSKAAPAPVPANTIRGSGRLLQQSSQQLPRKKSPAAGTRLASLNKKEVLSMTVPLSPVPSVGKSVISKLSV